MEMEQMMECLLAKIDARMDTNTKAVQEEMDATQERMERQIGSLVSIMEATRKTDRDKMKQEIRIGQEHIKEIMETQFGSLVTKLDGWQKKMQADQEVSKTTDLKANPEELDS
jgi:DNA relaxase NicK